MLDSMLGISAATVAFVEFVKSVFLQFGWFTALEEQQQSLVLQIVAFLAAIIATVSAGVNLFPVAPETLGFVLTGLIAGTGSAGIHVILALLGIRANVTAERQSKPITAQAAGGVNQRSYSAWM